MATPEELRRQIEEARRNNVTGAPLVGDVRENDARKNATMDRPLTADELAAADRASKEGKDALTSTFGGKLTDGDKVVAKEILGENVVEDKNAEAVKADLSSTLSSPGRKPADSDLEPSRTIQREDGTITTADRPDETAHYVHGNRVMMTKGKKEELDALTKALNELQDGRGIGDIPTTDIYWEKKKELDAFVARLKR